MFSDNNLLWPLLHLKDYHGPSFFHGRGLASWLLRMDSEAMLELIFRIWSEMVLYAAHQCSRDCHARQLSNGGEFLTVVWLVSNWRNRMNQLSQSANAQGL